MLNSIILVLAILLCALLTYTQGKSYSSLRQVSVFPQLKQAGNIATVDSFLYDVYFDGSDDMVEIDQEITLFNNQTTVLRIQIEPPLYEVISVGVSRAMPEIVRYIIQTIGTSSVALEGVTAPAALYSTPTSSSGYVPGFTGLSAKKDEFTTMSVTSSDGTSDTLDDPISLYKHDMKEEITRKKYPSKKSKSDYKKSGFNMIHNHLNDYIGSIKKIQSINMDREKALESIKEQFDNQQFNRSQGRDLLSTTTVTPPINPATFPHYGPPEYIPTLDGTNSQDIVDIINSVIYLGVSGTLQFRYRQNEIQNPISKCYLPSIGNFDSFNVPCNVFILLPSSSLIILTDSSAMMCISHMWKSWLADLAPYGGDCSMVPPNVIPNSQNWCYPGVDTGRKMSTWGVAAVNFIVTNRQARAIASVTMPTCNVPLTNYPPPDGENLALQYDSNNPMAGLGCNIIDPVTRLQYPATRAFLENGPLLDDNGNPVLNCPPGQSCSASDWVIDPRTNTYTKIDFNAISDNGLHKYYDSPDCECAAVDNNFYSTCPGQPWRADIPYSANLYGPSSPVYRVGSLQKCVPINQNLPKNPSPAQIQTALAGGGICTILNDDVLSFDYSISVKQRDTGCPSFPSECVEYAIKHPYKDLSHEDADILRSGGGSANIDFINRFVCSIRYIFHPSLCRCPCNTEAGSFQRYHGNLVIAQNAVTTGLVNEAQGLDNSIYNTNKFLSGTLMPDLGKATDALNNATLTAQLYAQSIISQEFSVAVQTKINNQSIIQSQTLVNELISNQTASSNQIFAELNKLALLINAVNGSNTLFANQSNRANQNEIDVIANNTQLLFLDQSVQQQAVHSMQQIAADYQAGRIRIDVLVDTFHIMIQVVSDTYNNDKLIPLVTNCTADFSSCGTAPTGIPDNATRVIDSVFDYPLEWQPGCGDTPTNVNTGCQKPRIHQWNWLMTSPLPTLLNYGNVTSTIDQMREMIEPGAMFVEGRHMSCLSNIVFGSLVTSIQLSSGAPGQFGLSTLMDFTDLSHFCVPGSVIQHESNVSEWSYEWSQSLQTDCTWPNLITYSNVWPGHYVVRPGNQTGIKLVVPHQPAYCNVDQFRRQIDALSLGQSTIISTIFSIFSQSFTCTLGSAALFQLYRTMIVPVLPEFGIVQTFKPVGSVYDQETAIHFPTLDAANLTRFFQDTLHTTDTSLIGNLTAQILQAKNTGGMINQVQLEFLAVGPGSVLANVFQFGPTIPAKVTILVANVSSNSTIEDALSSAIFTEAAADFASVGVTRDLSKFAGSLAEPFVLFSYLSDLFGGAGAPSPARVGVPTTRQLYLYDVDLEDVALHEKTWLESGGKVGSLHKDLYVHLLSQVVGDQYNLTEVFSYLNVSLPPNQLSNGKGLSQLAYLNATGTHRYQVDWDLNEILLEESIRQGQTITLETYDLMQKKVQYSPRRLSVGADSFIIPYQISSLILSSTSKYRIITIRCLIPPSQHKKLCQLFDQFQVMIPISWMTDGSVMDWWDRFYVRSIRSETEVQINIPRSVTTKIQQAQSICPQDIVTNLTTLSMTRPTLGLSVTLQYHFKWISVYFLNATNSSYADCAPWVSTLLPVDGWSTRYNLDTLVWESTVNRTYPATTLAAYNVSQSTITMPLPTVSTCQVYEFTIDRVEPNGVVEPCTTWQSTGINSFNAVVAESVYSSATNELSTRANLALLAQVNVYSQMMDQLANVIQTGVAYIHPNDNPLATFFDNTLLDGVIQNLLNNGTHPAASINGSQSYPIGSLSVHFNTNSSNATITLVPPTAAQIANNSFTNASFASNQASLSNSFNLSWSTSIADIESAAATLVSQFLETQANGAGVQLTLAAIKAIQVTLQTIPTLGGREAFTLQLEAAFNASASQTNQIILNAAQTPFFQSLNLPGVKCAAAFNKAVALNPNFASDQAAVFLQAYNYALAEDENNVVDGNPGSWANWIHEYGWKVFFCFVLSLLYLVFIVAPLVSLLGMLHAVQNSETLFFLAYMANYFYAPDTGLLAPVGKLLCRSKYEVRGATSSMPTI